jgi:pilus assembly protein CpaB
MRKGRIFFFLALILLVGLVAVAVVYYRFILPTQNTQTEGLEPTPVIDLVDVVVVSQKIQRGSKFDETVLSMIEIPRDVFIEGYYTDIANVVGRQARVDLDANMLLTTSMVVESSDQLSSTGSIAALTIPKGMVAVSIPINRLSSVSYAPQSGDHVNVIASMLLVDLDTDWQSITPNHSAAVLGVGPGVITGSGDEEGSTTSSANVELEKITAQIIAAGEASVIGRADFDPLLEQTFYVVPSETQRPRLVSQTLLQDAIVLRVGDFPLNGDVTEESTLDDPQVFSEETPPDETNVEDVQAVEPEPELPDLITLIVTPQDAVTLNYLIYTGAQLTLALRSAGDDTRVQTEAATLDFLLTQYNLPVPVKLPYGLEPRVDQILPPQLPNDIVPTPEE